MGHMIMLQGCGSNVGKSLLVAGLCRAARRRGLSVAPFKPQNMSNNAAVTRDGGEIGRAQALQALAAGLDPVSDMNPVLLKPESETGAQVVVHGQRLTTVRAGDYARLKPQLLEAVLDSARRLRAAHDLVIVEGAGSPAEINLRQGDIANMGFARAADVPVVLVGDIDRGGVIAQLVGTQAVLDPDDAAMIAGFLINKFRGDPRLFDDGYQMITDRTGWPGFGVVPWFPPAHLLPAEDALDLASGPEGGSVTVAALAFSRIANFDDLDPLAAEPDIRLVMVRPGQPIPGDARLVILPGSKSTCGDLAFLRAQGWDSDLAAHVRRGGHVLGLCGGYQMLGRAVHDPKGLEGPRGTTPGLGLLDVETVLMADKRLTRVTAQHAATGLEVSGYEIHLGQTAGPDCARPFAHVAGVAEGAATPDGRITGTYLHGLFTSDPFRAAYLRALGATPSDVRHARTVDQTLDALADHLEANLDVAALLGLARQRRENKLAASKGRDTNDHRKRLSMNRILVPTTGPEDWKRLLADPEKQWKHGYSAMAAAQSWEAANGVPREIAALLGDEAELLLALPEHKVALPGGRRASQCDIFALVRVSDETVALAVEAKVSEPFGPTVGEWMVNPSDGKIERMLFICDILGLKKRPRDDVRYQLLHRTAAAVQEAKRFKTDEAAMIVQSFSPSHRWFEDFQIFAGIFGLPAEPGKAVRHILPSGMPLTLGWAVGSEEFL